MYIIIFPYWPQKVDISNGHIQSLAHSSLTARSLDLPVDNNRNAFQVEDKTVGCLLLACLVVCEII